MKGYTRPRLVGEEGCRRKLEGFGGSARRQPEFVSLSRCITQRLRKSCDPLHFFTFFTCFSLLSVSLARLPRPVALSLSLSLATPLQTPRHQHELARVSFIRSDSMILPQFRTRFKKSMNRAGTTVRMEPLVFLMCQYTIPALRSSCKKRAK